VSLLSALNTGLSALNSTSTAIEVLSHNVSNVGTEGYSRQSLDLNTASPVNRSGLFLGRGVNMLGVSRTADSLLGRRLIGQTGHDASASTLRDNLAIVESFFDETQGLSVSEHLEQFYDAMGESTADPSDDGLRMATVASASALADAVNYTAAGLQEAVAGFDEAIGGTVETTNNALIELAAVNESIAASGGASGDLLDRRDQLIEQLAGTLGATASIEPDGQATLLVGGQAVVTEGEARTLSTGTDSAGNATVRVSVGGGFVDVTDYVGGEVGGLVESRELTGGYLDRVNEFAVTFADNFNAAHAAGFDSNGNPGEPLFTYDPADPAKSFAVNSDFEDEPGLLAYAGDASAAAGDALNLQALLDLEGAAIFDGGTRSGAAFLSALTGDVGRDAAGAAAAADQSAAALNDLGALREAISGVNLDEEAVRLVEVQSAYQAAARVISTTDEMLQTLIQL